MGDTLPHDSRSKAHREIMQLVSSAIRETRIIDCEACIESLDMHIAAVEKSWPGGMFGARDGGVKALTIFRESIVNHRGRL